MTIRFSRSDRLLFLSVGDLNRLVFLSVCDANLAHTLVVRNVAARLLNRFRRGFATDRLDVSGFVRDVRYVDVNEDEPQFAQFRFERLLDIGEERVAVAINFVDLH